MVTMIQGLWFVRSVIILGSFNFILKQYSLTCTNGNSNGCTSCDISSTNRLDYHNVNGTCQC